MAFAVCVLSLGGQLGTVCVEEGASVLELKAAIEAELGVAVASQRLFHRFTELTLESSMAALVAQAGDDVSIDVHLVRRTEEQLDWLKEIEALQAWQVRQWLLKQPECVRDDREVVRAAVSKAAGALQYNVAELMSSREVVLAIVGQAQGGRALQYASEELRADREVVLAAVRQSGWALRYAAKELRGDREIVMAAVSRCGWALSYASEELWSDREVVKAAVAESGEVLEHTTKELSVDPELRQVAGRSPPVEQSASRGRIAVAGG